MQRELDVRDFDCEVPRFARDDSAVQTALKQFQHTHCELHQLRDRPVAGKSCGGRF